MTTLTDKSVRIVDVAFDHDLAAPLVAAQVAELAEVYGGPDEAPVSGDHFFPPRGAFFLAVVGDVVVGCAGLRRLPAEKAAGLHPATEIKRMYVLPEFRGKGYAKALLQVAELRARALGSSWLLLETGDLQPEAIALYEAYGFGRIEGFGYYAGYDGQVAMAFDLTSDPDRRR